MQQGGKWSMMSWQNLSPQQAVQKPRRTSVEAVKLSPLGEFIFNFLWY
jgi:hypothetical protein